MAQHVPVMMNAKVMFVKVEAVAPLMALLAIQIRIVVDILLKAALMGPVRNKQRGADETTKAFYLVSVLAVSALLLTAVNVRAEVLSVPEIVDILVSFSNWKETGARCIARQLASIKRKDKNSVTHAAKCSLEGREDIVDRSVEIKDPIFNRKQILSCGNTGEM